MEDCLTSGDIEALFARPGGGYGFARWGRPMAPVVFGVEDETLAIVRAGFAAICALAGHSMAETDPELGSNVMLFFLRDWEELRAVPDLDHLIEGLGPLVDRLEAEAASQYRVFRFDGSGAIKACFAFVRMGPEMAQLPAATIALMQAVMAILDWGPAAFAARSPLAMVGEDAVLRPEIAALIRAAYDPVMPGASTDASHALRLAARMSISLPSGDAEE